MRYRRVVTEGATYFFTVVTHQRQPLFGDQQTLHLLTSAILNVRDRHPFEIDAQVILPDHIHTLWTLPDGDANYARRWRLIKETFTRSYCKSNGSPQRTEVQRARGEQPVWQRRFWEHVIRDERDFGAHLDYIHYNPVKHGLVSAPRDWPHSTFAEWVGQGAYEPAWGASDVPELPELAKRYD